MGAKVLQMPTNGNLRMRLEQALKEPGARLVDKGLSSFQNYDLHGRTVLYIGGKTDSPYCIVGSSLEGKLIGNARLRELPMTISCIRNAGKSIVPILGCGAFDAIRIQYFTDDLAIVIDAGMLLERIRRTDGRS